MTRVGLKTGRINTLSVPVPGGPGDQRRIADYLDHETATIDTLINKQQVLRDRLLERRQAVIDQTFLENLAPFTALKHLLVANDSGVWGDDPTGEGDTAVLRSTEQRADGSWRIDDPAMRSLTTTEISAARLRKNDILVTKTSGSRLHIGKASLVTAEMGNRVYTFGNFMQRLRAGRQLDPRFLWWWLRSNHTRRWIDLVATTSTGLMNLNGTLLGQIETPTSPLDKQRRIADQLDEETAKIDALIAKAERFIELAQERRTALITAAVTGQISVD